MPEPPTGPQAATAPASAEATGLRQSLRSRIIRGSVWSFAGDGGNYALRLASNLILTRLLFPEAFGVMALVNVFCQGLQTFSDIGIGPSIIQDKRGDDPLFLNTAFSMQVVRGVLLWLAACAGAVPVARLYEEPALAKLLPVAAIVAIISGFNSTNIYRQNRHLSLARPVMLELISQFISIVVMVGWSLVHRSVWALVAGNIAQSFSRAVLGHFILQGPKNRFAWDSSAARALTHFGKWIVMGTALGFLAARSDRLILGKLMTSGELGVYAIAVVMGHSVHKMVQRFMRRILFPAFGRLAEQGPERFGRQVTRMRMWVLLAALPPLCGLTVFGPQLIELCYDSRYHDAGWMLQILSAGGIFAMIFDSSTQVMMAQGDSFRFLVVMAVKSIVSVLGLIFGGILWGPVGAIAGMQLGSFVAYPTLVWGIHRYRTWSWRLDAAAALLSAALCSLGLWLMQA